MLIEQVVWGGGLIEAATNVCTHRLADRSGNWGGFPRRSGSAPTGHTRGGYWQDELHASWPQLAAAMGVER